MPRPTWGKFVLTLAALYPPVGAFAMDWNETHIYNPRWPGHAKFHDAQTLSLSAQCAALTLWQVWKPGPDSRSRLNWAALLATLFVASQAPAILFPGTGWADPETPLQPGRKFGIPINQLTIETGILGPLLGLGYALERRRLRRTGQLDREGDPWRNSTTSPSCMT
jgi:hypothetical protein